MKTKALAICLFFVLIVSCFEFVASAQGKPEEGEWFTSYRIEDPRTGQLMVEVDFAADENRSIAPIVEGSEVVMKFTINIPPTLHVHLLKLQTNLLMSTLANSTLANSTLAYWELLSNYELIYQEYNSTEVTFLQTKGELTMRLNGKIPYTATEAPPLKLIVLALYDSRGEILDEIRVRVITAVMDEYQILLLQKQNELQVLKDGRADPDYVKLYENILNESRVQASLGYVYSAIGMLNSLEISSQVEYSTIDSFLLPLGGVLIIVAVTLGTLFLRKRSRKKE